MIFVTLKLQAVQGLCIHYSYSLYLGLLETISVHGTINLSSYSFEGKVHQIIRDYMQCWPVFNMTFNVIQDAEAEEEEERKVKEEKNKCSTISLHEEDELKKMDKGTQTQRLP